MAEYGEVTSADGNSSLTARQVAELVGLHVNTVKRIPPEDLPYWTFGTRRDRRYTRTDVARFMAARRVG